MSWTIGTAAATPNGIQVPPTIQNPKQRRRMLLRDSRLGNRNAVEQADPKLTARRCLFGPVNHEVLQKDLQRYTKELADESSQRWNFDFTQEKPLKSDKGVYTWERVGDSDGSVPVAYDLPALRKDALRPTSEGIAVQSLEDRLAPAIQELKDKENVRATAASPCKRRLFGSSKCNDENDTMKCFTPLRMSSSKRKTSSSGSSEQKRRRSPVQSQSATSSTSGAVTSLSLFKPVPSSSAPSSSVQMTSSTTSVPSTSSATQTKISDHFRQRKNVAQSSSANKVCNDENVQLSSQ